MFATLAGRDDNEVTLEAWDRMSRGMFERAYDVLTRDVCSCCQGVEYCCEPCPRFLQWQFGLRQKLWDEIARSC